MAENELVISRVFDAPRDLVWKAWTDPRRIAVWWGPSGFGNTVKSMDVRAGGEWLFTMHGPDGTDYPSHVRYREVEAPSELAYLHGEEGSHSFFQVRVSFAESAGAPGKTDVVYRMAFPTAEGKRLAVEKYGAAEGLSQTMGRLETYLRKPGLLLSRVFAAPRASVWYAWTDPIEMRKWWGPVRFTCPGARIDLRVGGSYLLGMRSPEGQEFWGTGIYKEIVPFERLVYTDSFSDAQGKVIPAATLGLPGNWPEIQMVTVAFAELGKGKTLLTVHQESLPPEWRDMTAEGWSTSFDKLAGILD